MLKSWKQAGTLIILLACSRVCFAVPTVDPSTGHAYEYIAAADISWTAARGAASGMTYGNRPGRLATIQSAAENTFITNLLPVPATTGTAWIGGLQDSAGAEPAGGWGWITGEPFSYTNWYAGEPNQNAGNNEDNLQIYATNDLHRGLWNDYPDNGVGGDVLGYVVEFELKVGACCLPANGCVLDITDVECHAMPGGHFLGEGSTSCPHNPNGSCKLGACCRPNNVCTQDTTVDECIKLGGRYLGDGTTTCAHDAAGNCIPTVSEWGLVVMAVLVLSAATVVIMRRRAIVRGGP